MTLSAWRRAVLLGAVVVALANSGAACSRGRADGQRVSLLKAGFAEWAAQHGVKGGALAIVEHGQVVGSLGIGRVTPSDPQPIASNSKSITAICILRLVEAGKLRFEDTLGTLLTSYFADHPPADPRARNITLSALLTHTSGLGSDPTQGTRLLQFRPFSEPAAAKILTAALAEPIASATYAYNNANYAALEVVVETVTHEAYAAYCARTVLQPVAITDASVNRDWQVMGAFGGWKLSAEDGARFLAYFDPSAGLVKTQPAAWPRASLGGGAFYSLGTNMRQTPTGHNFWHFGSWTWTGQPKASFGAFFARWSNGYGVAANYHPTVDRPAVLELNRRMWEAVQ